MFLHIEKDHICHYWNAYSVQIEALRVFEVGAAVEDHKRDHDDVSQRKIITCRAVAEFGPPDALLRQYAAPSWQNELVALPCEGQIKQTRVCLRQRQKRKLRCQVTALLSVLVAQVVEEVLDRLNGFLPTVGDFEAGRHLR